MDLRLLTLAEVGIPWGKLKKNKTKKTLTTCPQPLEILLNCSRWSSRAPHSLFFLSCAVILTNSQGWRAPVKSFILVSFVTRLSFRLGGGSACTFPRWRCSCQKAGSWTEAKKKKGYGGRKGWWVDSLGLSWWGHKTVSIVSLFLIFQIQEVLKVTLGHEQFRLKWVSFEVNKKQCKSTDPETPSHST